MNRVSAAEVHKAFQLESKRPPGLVTLTPIVFCLILQITAACKTSALLGKVRAGEEVSTCAGYASKCLDGRFLEYKITGPNAFEVTVECDDGEEDVCTVE